MSLCVHLLSIDESVSREKRGYVSNLVRLTSLCVHAPWSFVYNTVLSNMCLLWRVMRFDDISSCLFMFVLFVVVALLIMGALIRGEERI